MLTIQEIYLYIFIEPKLIIKDEKIKVGNPEIKQLLNIMDVEIDKIVEVY